MALGTIRDGEQEVAVHVGPRGVARVADLLPGSALDTLGVVVEQAYPELAQAAQAAADAAFVPADTVSFTAPYRNPRKIWGIGLNYREHAGDLSEAVPTEPASFIKGDHTIIGPGDPIPVPHQSVRTTAEAELGLVIGTLARDVPEADALSHVFGVVTVLDQTAEDILERNPRFLTRSKNFPGFFSFGPVITPLAEVEGFRPDLSDIEVRTVLNGALHRANVVANMTFSPSYLVSMHSEVMPLFPGDLLSTGTPGAVHVTDGDVVTCDIPGIGTLTNPVVDQP